jgi:mono/diheme cytochrome c family protein
MVASLALGACAKDKDETSGAARDDTAQMAPGGSQPPSRGAGGGQATAPAAAAADSEDVAGDDATMARARQIFAMQCQHCHGPRGRGDGPMGKQMNPGPRDYGSKEWQQSVTDERIAEVIVKGGQGTGLNPMMPANPTLASQPELLDAMVKLIRSFATE